MTPMRRAGGARSWLLVGALCAVGVPACTPTTFVNGWPVAYSPVSLSPIAFWNNTLTLGGDDPGRRGFIYVAFINNTSYRAIFTFGTYDPQNTEQDTNVEFPIQFEQLFADADDADNRLDPFDAGGIFAFECGRAVSIGGAELIDLIEENNLEFTTTGRPIQVQALRPVSGTIPGRGRAGIAFSDLPLGDPEANTDSAGWAPGPVTLQGAEYWCDSLLVYTFEEDDRWPGGIRVDLDVILP